MALPAAIMARSSMLDAVNGAAAEYRTVTEIAENLLKSIDDAATKKEPSGTASEQLRQQQVDSFSADYTGD